MDKNSIVAFGCTAVICYILAKIHGRLDQLIKIQTLILRLKTLSPEEFLNWQRETKDLQRGTDLAKQVLSGGLSLEDATKQWKQKS